MTILILHGIMGNNQENWLPFLSNKLESQNRTVICPNLPNSDHPDRNTWLESIRNELKDVNPSELIIIGHSLGALSALDYLESATSPIYGFIPVSGFITDWGLEIASYFITEKEIDHKAAKKNIKHIEVVCGENDPYVPHEKLTEIAHKLGVSPKIIKNGGHLNESAGFQEFPQLFTLVQNMIAEKDTDYIDKLAFLGLKDGQILGTISRGKDTWYIPGGKRETGETDYQALIREVKEELEVEIKEDTIRYYDTFTAQAHGKPEGTLVRMTCYTSDYVGEPTPNAEIDKVQYIDYSYRDESAPVDMLIFDDLKENGLLK